jgi:hypothetical protein
MRSAIFFGALIIAKSIDSGITGDYSRFFAWLVVIFMVADFLELLKKLSK